MEKKKGTRPQKRISRKLFKAHFNMYVFANEMLALSLSLPLFWVLNVQHWLSVLSVRLSSSFVAVVAFHFSPRCLRIFTFNLGKSSENRHFYGSHNLMLPVVHIGFIPISNGDNSSGRTVIAQAQAQHTHALSTATRILPTKCTTVAFTN